MDSTRGMVERLRSALAEDEELHRRHEVILASAEAVARELEEHVAALDRGEGARERPSWPVGSGDPDEHVEFVDPKVFPARLVEATRRHSHLRISTRGLRLTDGLDASLAAAKISAMGRGAIHRVLYDESTLGQQDARHHMRYWGEAGEQQRIVADLPAEFILLGDESVVLMPEPGEPVACLQTPAIVAAYTSLFELAWGAGVPDPARPGTSESERLLTLLERGYKDESIARHLGVSLRTVRRRIAALMAEAGVSTRFQLGQRFGKPGAPER